ncbi:MAG: enoyl-CoA hydratase-related protein [Pseudomonadota bacterium]
MTWTSMRIDREGGLARWTFTQPERGNPIDGTFCAEFCDAANELSDDPGVRAVLLTAEGKSFSFGGDVKLFVQDLDNLPRLIKRWTADLHMGIARLQRMNAPVVAAVQGICAGGMAACVAGADVVVAEPGTRFVAAYAGIGYSNDAGASIMLSRRMGIARAKRYLLLNETLDAQTALAAGLADEVVAAEELLTRAEAVARKLADGPTLAFGEMRRLLNSVADQPLETQLELEAQGLARMSATADAREGLLAFAEKRKPRFTGQ